VVPSQLRRIACRRLRHVAGLVHAVPGNDTLMDGPEGDDLVALDAVIRELRDDRHHSCAESPHIRARSIALKTAFDPRKRLLAAQADRTTNKRHRGESQPSSPPQHDRSGAKEQSALIHRAARQSSAPPRERSSATAEQLPITRLPGTTNSTLPGGSRDERFARDAALADPRRGQTLGASDLARCRGSESLFRAPFGQRLDSSPAFRCCAALA
jgi:hypothetical protein